MAVLNNVTEDEVLSIIGAGDQSDSVRYRWDCKLVTRLGEVEAYKVVSVYLNRNYLENYADEMKINLLVPPGSFESIIVPERNDIEAVVTQTPVATDSSSTEALSNQHVSVKRYRAIMEDSRSQRLEGNLMTDQSVQDMDTKTIRPVTLVLLEKGIEQLRTVAGGGVFRNTTSTNLLRFLFSRLSRQVQIDNSDMVQGVDVVDDVAIDKPISQLIIDHKVLLKDMPAFVQKNHGVYSTGIGRYLQNRVWYIYPTYDVTRFAKATRKMTLLNLPSNMMTGFKKTSRYIDGHLYLVSTEEALSADGSNARQINEGNGVRYVMAEKLFNGMVQTGDNRARLERRNNTAEFVALKRPTGVNYAPMSTEEITGSHAYQQSKIASREGMLMQLGWESSEPSYVTPGMAVRFLVPYNGVVKARYGTVVGSETQVFSNDTTIRNTSHLSKTVLTLFLEPDTEIEE